MLFCKFLKDHNLIKNVSLIAGGTVFSQLIGVVFTLLVARLYSPKDYGTMNVFMSVIGILHIGAILTYEKSIPIVRHDDAAKTMVIDCLKILLVTSAIVFFVCLVLPVDCFAKLNIAVIYNYRFAIPVAMFLTGLYTIFTQWAYRRRNYSIIPQTQILQSLVGGLVKALGGLISPHVFWLISGTIVNEFCGVSSLIRQAFRDKVFVCLSNDGVGVLKEQYRFPLYMLPNDIINAFAVSGPVLILAYLYDTTVCGYYGLMNTVINLPMNLVCMSISKVVYAEAAHLTSDNAIAIRDLCVKVTKYVAFGAILPLAILYVWGPELFSLVFGEKWHVSGEYAKLMIGYFWVYSIVLPIGRVMEVFSKQWIGLATNVIRAFLLVIAVYLFKSFSAGVETVVLSLSLINAVIYGVSVFIFFHVINCFVKIQKARGMVK